MKKIFFGITATVSLVLNLSAQSNNEYNKVGVDFVKSLKILQTDYDNGKIKAIEHRAEPQR